MKINDQMRMPARSRYRGRLVEEIVVEDPAYLLKLYATNADISGFKRLSKYLSWRFSFYLDTSSRIQTIRDRNIEKTTKIRDILLKGNAEGCITPFVSSVLVTLESGKPLRGRAMPIICEVISRHHPKDSLAVFNETRNTLLSLENLDVSS